MAKPCKWCGSVKHFSFQCFKNPKNMNRTQKPRKAIKQRGKRSIEYEEWRDTVAIPYLDEKYGRVCVDCGEGEYGLHILDVEHKKGRGSHQHLVMTLSNVQYMGRYPCHYNKTNHLGKYKES